MTVKQAQWQLLFLDYYGGAVDGIWGPKSKAATLQFQKEFFEGKGGGKIKNIIKGSAAGFGDDIPRIECFYVVGRRRRDVIGIHIKVEVQEDKSGALRIVNFQPVRRSRRENNQSTGGHFGSAF